MLSLLLMVSSSQPVGFFGTKGKNNLASNCALWFVGPRIFTLFFFTCGERHYVRYIIVNLACDKTSASYKIMRSLDLASNSAL
jgi:hypothetical protein